MPANSKTQQRLMGWAYSCKTGSNKNCPPYIKKISDNMSTDDLRKFAKTKHSGLPDKVTESMVYKLDGANKVLLRMLYDWMDKKGVEYIPDKTENKLEITDTYHLTQYDQEKLLDFIEKLELKKLWEDASGASFTNDGNTFATLASSVGMKNVNPPAPGQVGSGDRFDNALPLSVRKKKKEEEQQRAEENDPMKYIGGNKSRILFKNKRR